jgi:hypothetical protein
MIAISTSPGTWAPRAGVTAKAAVADAARNRRRLSAKRAKNPAVTTAGYILLYSNP